VVHDEPGFTELLVYHFVFGPPVDGWRAAGCVGCSTCRLQHGSLYGYLSDALTERARG
jgi:predicted dithiol-disulfide oxidoreductase (DUF899 family)